MMPGILHRERARWFLWAPVCFAIGIAIYFELRFEPNFAYLALLLAGTIMLVCSQRRVLANQPLAVALVLVAAGAVASKLRTIWVEAPTLERPLYGAVVEGVIEYVQPRNSRGPRITLRVRSIKSLRSEETPQRIRVRFQKPLPQLSPGQLISFKATLNPPAAPALPGGYDFARAAYYKSIGGVGFAIGSPVILPPPDDIPRLVAIAAQIQTLRQSIGARVRAILDGQTGAIANALMIGERGQIERATLEAYRDAGLLHLLSISGLHMAIMAGSFFFAVRLLLANLEVVALCYAIKKWAAFSAIVAATAYLLISGSTHATLRAFVMVSIMMCAIMLDRPGLALRNVAIAAMAILIVSPESLLHAGFQMSFAAVIALISTYEYFRERRTRSGHMASTWLPSKLLWFFLGIIGSTVIASVAVAPIAAFHFHKSQQFAVLANLIAVPVCNLIVMPAALLAFLLMPIGLEAIPLAAMGYGIDVMTWCAVRVAALPGAVSSLPAFSTLAFALIVLGGLWLCLWQQIWRWFGVVIIVAGLALAQHRQKPDLLAGRDGRLVALRQADGKLVVMRSRSAKFELEQWLAHDGDSRPPAQLRNRVGFKCDSSGCVSELNEKYVAISNHPLSLNDDCVRAIVLVLSYPRPAACETKTTIVWDYWDLRHNGTHTYRTKADGTHHITTVAAYRGDRPWTQSHRRKGRRTRRATRRRFDGSSRLSQFAAQQRLQARGKQLERPENEGDEFGFDRF